MKKTFYLGLYVLLIFSCSPVPSVHKIQQSFENRELNIQTGWIKIISFQKTNAQKGVRDGIKFYRVGYEAQIEFLKRVWEINPEEYNNSLMNMEYGSENFKLMSANLLTLWPDSLEGKFWDVNLLGYPKLGILRNKNEIRKLSGVLLFEMTEKGWQLTNMTEELS